MNDQDVHNFSSSSSHRLPTVSASQAIRRVTLDSSRSSISTGIKDLDLALLGPNELNGKNMVKGGIPRGQVTEIFGPPGVGTSSFAMQTCTNALHAGLRVAWVDCGNPIAGPRLCDMLKSFQSSKDEDLASSPPTTNSVQDLLGHFSHFSAASLPHLLNLLFHSSEFFTKENPGLIVLDSISTLFSHAFPRMQFDKMTKAVGGNRADAIQWATGRRWAVQGDFMTRLGKLAATKNLAVLVTLQTAMKARPGGGAVLLPAISSNSWDGGIVNRIVLFRDWSILQLQSSNQEHQSKSSKVRFAGVLKARGISNSQNTEIGKTIPFIIDMAGLHQIDIPTNDQNENTQNLTIIDGPLKRKHAEIADSQSDEERLDGSDDDYGWGQDDDIATDQLLEHEVVATRQSVNKA